MVTQLTSARRSSNGRLQPVVPVPPYHLLIAASVPFSPSLRFRVIGICFGLAPQIQALGPQIHGGLTLSGVGRA